MLEYAAFQKKSLDACKMMNSGIKEELKNRVDHAIRMYERGMITVDETMRLLSLPDNGEDMSAYMK